MKSGKGPSRRDLKRIIANNLREVGVDPELIEIYFSKENRIIVRGEVYTENEKNLAIQAIAAVVGAEDIDTTGLFVMDEWEDARLGQGDLPDELLDEDKEYVGTEDVFRSVEEGLPYVPPVIPPNKGGKKKRGKE